MTDEKDQWHLNKGVSVTQIITIISLIFGIGAMWSDLNRQLEINSHRIQEIEQNQMVIKGLETRVAVIESVMNQYRATQVEMREDIKAIRRKVSE